MTRLLGLRRAFWAGLLVAAFMLVAMPSSARAHFPYEIQPPNWWTQAKSEGPSPQCFTFEHHNNPRPDFERYHLFYNCAARYGAEAYCDPDYLDPWDVTTNERYNRNCVVYISKRSHTHVDSNNGPEYEQWFWLQVYTDGTAFYPEGGVARYAECSRYEKDGADDGWQPYDCRSKLPQPNCADGVSNDFDGLADYPLDPGCADARDDELGSVQCDNGLDDDGDGSIDWPSDRGCDDVYENQEKDCFNSNVSYQFGHFDPEGIDNVYGGHKTFITWCAEPGNVTLSGPVSSGMDIPFDYRSALFEELGAVHEGDADWAEPLVYGERTGEATVEVFPELRDCLDIGTIVSWVPAFRLIGKAAWPLLPESKRRAIVSRGLGVYLRWVRSMPGLSYREDELLAQLVSNQSGIIFRSLMEGELPFETECNPFRGTITIHLRDDGTVRSSFREDSINTVDLGVREGEGTTEPIDLERFMVLPRPNGTMTLGADAPGAGKLVAAASTRGKKSALAAKKKAALAKGKETTGEAGPVLMTLRPTKAGRKFLRKDRTTEVTVALKFTSSGGETTVTSVHASFGSSPPK